MDSSVMVDLRTTANMVSCRLYRLRPASVHSRALRLIVTALALALVAAAHAQSTSKLPATHSLVKDGQLTIDIADLCPRFLKFYDAAQAALPAARWQLWNDLYGFAAVPPTPAGAELAHKMLDSAWPRYADIQPLVRQGAAALRPDPRLALPQVADALALTEPFEMELVVYVGDFDGNTFTTVQHGKPVVAVPIEMDAGDRELALRHEMTHAVQITTAALSGGWERSIAETIFQEGLAMRATEALVPGLRKRIRAGIRAGLVRKVHGKGAGDSSRYSADAGAQGLGDGGAVHDGTRDDGNGARGIRRRLACRRRVAAPGNDTGATRTRAILENDLSRS